MRKRHIWMVMALATGLTAILTTTVSDSQETRSARVMYSAPEGGNKGFRGEVALYDRSHAIVIGIDKYDTIRPLTGAVRDARAVEAALKGHGFEVTALIDAKATRTAITEFLANELRTKVGKNDRVIIYFAGHGTTLGDGPMATGYLMPEGREKHPINGVTWDQAVAFCTWAGKRLPTEAGWETAARGKKSLTYPWATRPPSASWPS